MSEINDGGAAFPHQDWDPVIQSQRREHGMSIRDVFAGNALAGLGEMCTPLAQVAEKRGALFADAVAGYCYEVADAMLAARSKSKV